MVKSLMEEREVEGRISQLETLEAEGLATNGGTIKNGDVQEVKLKSRRVVGLEEMTEIRNGEARGRRRIFKSRCCSTRSQYW